MSDECRVLAVNPGSTSTKVACFDGERCIMERTLTHSAAALSRYATINDQREVRRDKVLDALNEVGITLDSLSAVVGRGGLIHPVEGGTYRVDATMLTICPAASWASTPPIWEESLPMRSLGPPGTFRRSLSIPWWWTNSSMKRGRRAFPVWIAPAFFMR